MHIFKRLTFISVICQGHSVLGVIVVPTMPSLVIFNLTKALE